MTSKRSLILHWADQGSIDETALEKAFEAVGITPQASAWRGFLDKLFLWLGSLSLAFAAMFFIAYNWDLFDRYAKFALVQGLIVLSVLAYWRLGADKLSAKVALLVSTILLGVLLALYGQTYQTGADPWQLFFNWALLILPWAIIGRFAATWIVWVLLVNLSAYLYFRSLGGWLWMSRSAEEQMLWTVFLFNGAVLVAWELLATRFGFLNERWAIRIVALLGGSAITWLAMYTIVGRRGMDLVSIPTYVLCMSLLYYFYRRKITDLFMLAAGCLSGIIVVTSFFGKAMMEGRHDSSAYLLLALIVIAMGAGSAYWLRKVQQERLQ